MSTYEMGEWVQVWGQIVEVNPHPEEVTVRMESHNEDYHCLVRRDRVTQADKTPEFASRCNALFQDAEESLWRCVRHHDHGGDHRDRSGFEWDDAATFGYMEER